MTNHEPSESNRNVYDACDPQYLRQLREAAGMDLVVLARTACLSVAQVRQLETKDSDSLFYSDAIKRQAYKRLLMILGAEPPSVELPQELRDAGKVAQAHLNTLDQIVAMSEQPTIHRPTSDVLGAGVAKLYEHKQALGSLILLIAAVALLVWNYLQSDASALGAVHQTSVPTPPALVSTVAAQVSSAPVVVASAPVVLDSTATLPVASAPMNFAEVSSPALASTVVATPKAGACAHSTEAMPELTSLLAQKEGRYVYFVSTTHLDVCVVDGNKQVTLLQLKPGDKRSVYGVSPWQLSSTGLKDVQIYFQGGRLILPDAKTTRFKLIEVPVAH